MDVSGMKMSYHDLHVTTPDLERTSIFDLPFGYELICNRVGGWSLWYNQEQVAGEYGEKWLILDINGYVILGIEHLNT